MWDDRPGNCFLVLVGVKYFQMVEEIEERMKAIHDKLNIVVMEKIFLFEQRKADDLPVTKRFTKPKVRKFIKGINTLIHAINRF